MLLALSLLAPALPVGEPGSFDSAFRLSQLDGVGQLRLAGDLDADGDLDLVALTTNSPIGFSWSGFQVLINEGDLDFVTTDSANFGFTPSPFSSVGVNHPRLADLTGDGLPEIILDIQSAPTFDTWVYPNTGGGMFGPRIELGSWGTQQVVADRDGDGTPELAHFVADGNNTRVDWFGYNGSTIVLESSDTIVDVPLSGVRPTAIRLDGDADTDIAFITGAEEILLLTNVGGSLVPSQTLSTPGIVPPNAAIFAEDFNQDGDDDIVVVKFISSATSMPAAAFDNDGSDNFTEIATTVPNFFPFYLESSSIVDWDNDGDLDVISRGQGSPQMFENTGSYQFVPAESTTTEFGFIGVGSFDITGDGFFDYIGSRTISIGDGSFGSGLGEDDLTLKPFGTPSYDLVLDWEGDGDTDLLSRNGSLYTNDATGAFTFAGSKLPPSPPGFSIGTPIAFGDFDGDGHSDWLTEVRIGTSIASMGLAYSDQKGGFLIPDAVTPAFVGISLSSNGRLWPVGDFDGDGDGDMFVKDGVWLNNGSADMTFHAGPYAGTPLLVANLAGDDALDFVVSAPGNSLVLWTQTGAGATPQALGASGSLAAVIQRLDVDGDGDLDLVAVDEDPNLNLFENESGTYAAPAVLTAAEDFIPGAIAVEDFDGDGTAELLAMREGTSGADSNPKLEVWSPNGGAFAFELRSSWVNLGYGTGPNDPGTMRYFDADGDGDLDGVGRYVVRNLRFCGDDDGGIRQYGAAFPGAGGYEPVLGAQGPARVGSPTMELRLRQASGGAPVFLALSASEGLLADFPVPGMTFLLGDLITLIPLSADGTPGDPGAGAVTIPISVLPGFAGVTFFHQAFVLDSGAPDGLASSNGLEVVYGI